MRILIVGRTLHTGSYLTKALSEAGFVVDWIHDSLDSQRQAGSGDYDLVILDLVLPRAQAWYDQGHSERSDMGPLLMTASLPDSDGDGEGDAGKTFADQKQKGPHRIEFPKLLAQIRTILHCGDDSSILNVGDLQLNLKRRNATRQGRSILLTAKEFSLLWLLMRRHGEVLPRAIIASQVWDMNFASGTNVVDVLVRRLRLKIDNGHFPKLIHTVRNMGYVCEDRTVRGEPSGMPRGALAV